MASPARTNGNQNLPARQDPVKTVHDLLMRQKEQIKLALPKHLDVDRMVRVSLSTIRQTPKLLDCDPMSLIKCVMQASALGLEPDPLLGRAYLVPYGRECTLIIGYKGLIDLARRSGEIESIEAHVVYEADEWRYSYGLTPELYHRPADTDQRGRVVAAWALARFKGGGYQFEVMSSSDLERIRRGSKAGNNGPWVSHTEEMQRKTVLRRLCKLLPLSPQIHTHLTREESFDAGVPVLDMGGGEMVFSPSDSEAPAPESQADRILAAMDVEEREPGADG